MDRSVFKQWNSCSNHGIHLLFAYALYINILDRPLLFYMHYETLRSCPRISILSRPLLMLMSMSTSRFFMAWCHCLWCTEITMVTWFWNFLCPCGLGPWRHRAFGLSIHVYMRTSVCRPVLRFLSKAESQELLMVASWYFIWGCISMRPAGIYKSHDLMTYISWSTDFGQIIKVKIFVHGKMLSSTNASTVASCYLVWGCTYMRLARIYNSHDLMTYISQSANFRLWPIFYGEDFCHR